MSQRLSPKFIGFIVAAVMLCSLTGIAAKDSKRVILATTTSTQDSGLLDKLKPLFEKKTGYRLDIMAVGTGKAMELGRNGDADVLLVHARKQEDEFVAQGYGINRRDVMYNDFIVLGPAEDPANINGTKSVVGAFKRIADSRSTFISRGDKSGTHTKELEIWSKAGIKPVGPWYLEAGQGMAASLAMAGEKQAYILADRATFAAYKSDLGLVVICEGDDLLFNPYGVIAVNPKKYEHVNYAGAMAFIEFITSDEGQAAIKAFKIGGKQVFYPLYKKIVGGP